MKSIKNLNDLMVEQLRETFDAEVHLVPFIGKLATQVEERKLAELIFSYGTITSDNCWVLKQVFNNMFTQKRGEKSSAIRQMIVDTEALVDICATPEVTEATIILSLQHIIHYKIATYGALSTYAKILELHNESHKLHELLSAEKKIDRKLAILADEEIDQKAHSWA